MALFSLCKKCGVKILYGKNYCKKCSKEKYIEDKNNIRYYDTHIRDKKAIKFYHSREWKRLVEQVKQRDNGLCKLCLEKHSIKNYDVVHHIIEIKEDWNKRLDIDNCICLCNSCHNVVHSKYNTKAKNEITKHLQEMVGGM